MKAARFLSLFWVFSWVIGFWAGPASGLTIYRFGGEDRPKPPEEGQAGVDFRQLSWMDFDAEPHGEIIDLDVDSTGIQPLKRNPDFNIAPAIEEKGGKYLRADVNVEVWDGDTGTFWLAEQYLCAKHRSGSRSCIDVFGRSGTANIYLGGLYNIDRIRVISGFTDPGRTVGILRVHIGPRPIVNYGIVPPKSPWIVEIRDNREQILDIPIPAHEAVEFVQVALAEHNTDWEVNEIEVYAKGFVKQATYISDVIDFEQPMAWGDLRWSGVQEPGAQVLIRTRSGLDEDADVFWRFTGRGSKAEVSRAGYSGLKLNERAGITHDLDHWTFWSAPYDFADSSGTPVVSASPRRYFQFKIDFLPRENAGGRVGFVELRASEPVATNLVGEVWPVEAKVGQQSTFTYALRPTIHPGDVGFDQLEIETSSIISAVEAVRIGDVPVTFTVEAEEPHRLAVSFPRLQEQDSGTLVEVDFAAQVLRYGAIFAAQVSDSDQPLEVPQGVNPGDATTKYEGNRVSVATAAQEQRLLQVRVEPTIFTPNGDGRNDQIGIFYHILEITGSAQVTVEVWDLSGRRVRQVYSGADGIGEYERAWDGRDEADSLVPPGIYLYRVSVDADREKVEKTGVVYATY